MEIIAGFVVGFIVATVIGEIRYYQVKKEIDRLFNQTNIGGGQKEKDNKLLTVQDLLKK